MTKIELAALRILADQREDTLLRPGYLGTLLWPETSGTPRSMARPAGSVLRRLAERGFVDHRHERWTSGWYITDEGRRALRGTVPSKTGVIWIIDATDVWATPSSPCWVFGAYRVNERYVGYRSPWGVMYKGEAVMRGYGNLTGFLRFKTAEAAKKWVEKRSRERGWAP